MSTILLASGNSFDLSSPETSTFTIEDIAHGLSNICRFGGQSSRFYSVAQHSVLASLHVAPEHAYAALMHDAAEAIIGDVAKPLKGMLPDYRALEQRVEAAVFGWFDVPYPLSPEVKDIDLWMLATEQHYLMPDRAGRSYAGGKEPLEITLWPMGPEEAKAAFLARYHELRLSKSSGERDGLSVSTPTGKREAAEATADYWEQCPYPARYDGGECCGGKRCHSVTKDIGPNILQDDEVKS